MIQRAAGYRRDAPWRARVLFGRDMPSALVKEKCVSALELSRMTPRPSGCGRRQDHRKDVGPEPGKARRQPQPAGVGESPRSAAMRRQRSYRVGRQPAWSGRARARGRPARRRWPTASRIWRNRLQGLVGRSRRAGLARSTMLRSWLPGRISVRSAKARMSCQHVEELRPFGRAAGIGDVAGDQERDRTDPAAWMCVEQREHLGEAPLPRGPGRPLSMRKP